MRRSSAVLCALLLVFAAAGCGSSESSSDGGKATTTTATDGGDAATDGSTTTTDPGTAGDKGADGADAEAYTAALVKGFSSGDLEGGDLVLTKAQARCVAPKWIDEIGTDRLVEQDIAVTALEDTSFAFGDLGLSESQGNAMIDAFTACKVDIYVLFIGAISTGMTADQKACLEKNIDRASARDLLVASLISNDEADNPLSAKLQSVAATCNLSGGG